MPPIDLTTEQTTQRLQPAASDWLGKNETSLQSTALDKHPSLRSGRLPSRFSGRRAIYLIDLLIELVSREMKLIYKRSALGILWALLKPLLQLSVLYFIFHSVLTLKIAHYAPFLFIGVLAWSWFQTSLTYATAAITENVSLLRQPAFSPSILPIVVVSTWLMHFLLAMPIMFLSLYFEGIPLHSTVFLMPAMLAIQFIVTLTVAYPLAALQVTFRDVQHTLVVCLNLMFYFTPIVYSLSTVPDRYKWLYKLNPIGILIESYRAVLLNGTQPDWGALLAIFCIFSCLMPIAQQIFKARSVRFVEEL